MSKYKMVVLSNPVAGRDQEYLEWYKNVHVPDAKALAGVTSGALFRVVDDKPWKYMAEYDLECDDPARWWAYAQEEMKKMVLSDAFDFNTVVSVIVEPLNDK